MIEVAEAVRWLGIGLVAICWLYIAARAVSRAVVRTLNEQRKENNGKE